MHNASEYRDIRKKIVLKNGRTQYLVQLTVKMQWHRHRVHFKCLSYDIFSLKWDGARFLYNKQQATGHCLCNNCVLPCPYVCTTQSDRMLICPARLLRCSIDSFHNKLTRICMVIFENDWDRAMLNDFSLMLSPLTSATVGPFTRQSYFLSSYHCAFGTDGDGVEVGVRFGVNTSHARFFLIRTVLTFKRPYISTDRLWWISVLHLTGTVVFPYELYGLYFIWMVHEWELVILSGQSLPISHLYQRYPGRRLHFA